MAPRCSPSCPRCRCTRPASTSRAPTSCCSRSCSIYVAIMAVRLSQHRARPRRAAGARAGRCRRRRRDAERRADAGVDARMSELLALGISHKTAPVALRERLALHRARRRSEFAAAGDGDAGGARGGRDLDVQPHRGLPRRRRRRCAPSPTCSACSRARASIRPTELAEAIYSPRNCDAARQLYRVTAGLESMIVGEAEIQGQVKRAHEAAMRAGLHRPAVQPPVRGRADDRQARAHGDGHRLQPRQHPVGRRRPRAERARRPGGAPRGRCSAPARPAS